MQQHSSTSSSENEQPKSSWRLWKIVALIVVEIELIFLLVAPKEAPITQGARYYLGGMPIQTTQSIVNWQTQRALDLKKSPDVIVFGDSSALVGVIPPLIQKQTRLTCQNFGLVQDVTIKSHVDMLELFLKKHRKPRMLVYHFSDGVLATPNPKLHKKGMFKPYQSWLGKDRSLETYWPSHRFRTIARHLVLGHWHEDLKHDTSFRKRLIFTQGYLPDSRTTKDWSKAGPPHVLLHEDGLKGLKRLLTKTQQWRLPLLVMHAPMPKLFAYPKFHQMQIKNQRTLRALLKSYPHARLATPYTRYLPVKYFADFHHVNHRGAILNSRTLGGWINRLLPQKR